MDREIEEANPVEDNHHEHDHVPMVYEPPIEETVGDEQDETNNPAPTETAHGSQIIPQNNSLPPSSSMTDCL